MIHSNSVNSPLPHLHSLSVLMAIVQNCFRGKESSWICMSFWAASIAKILRDTEMFLALPRRSGKSNPLLLDHHRCHGVGSGQTGMTVRGSQFALRVLGTNSVLACYTVSKFYVAVC